MSRENINVPESILFYAFRYALHRKTYAVKDVQDEIIINWSKLSPNIQERIQKEINEDIAQLNSIDKPLWDAICKLEISSMPIRSQRPEGRLIKEKDEKKQ